MFFFKKKCLWQICFHPNVYCLQIDRVKGCFEMISALLDYHHHNQNAYVKPDRGDPSHHRLVYLGTISLFAHVLHLVPAEKVRIINKM